MPAKRRASLSTSLNNADATETQPTPPQSLEATFVKVQATKKTTLELDMDVFDALKLEAVLQKTTMRELVNIACREWLKDNATAS